ncbi:MAG: DMT family transporter [Bacteroidales bacterium]|nr:DMT family transporter [Bacteroidales bacterium]MDY0216302.1 DMT family transporter [Bacteroidales bacterium]
MKTIQKSVIYALLAVACWSTVATAFKLALAGMSFMMLLVISSFVAAFSFLVVLMAKKETKKPFQIPLKKLGKPLLKGFLNPFLYYLILFKAYDLLPAQEALILNYVWPIILVIFSVLFLGQKLLRLDIPSILICFLGVVVIATQGNISNFQIDNALGIFLALISSLIWALYWILNMDKKEEARVQFFLGFFIGFIFSFATLLFFPENWEIKTTQSLIAAIYVGLFEMSIPFLLWQLALTKARSTAAVSRFIFLSPFLSLMLISLILKEEILLSSFIGLLLIITGITIQGFGKREKVN